MNLSDLLNWYKTLNNKKIPKYIEIMDANNNQVCVDNSWMNVVNAWGICFDGKKWKYIETDSERGYVDIYKLFNTEEDVVNYAKDSLRKTYLSFDGNSKSEMLTRFIQKKFGYTQEHAIECVETISKYDDIFEEFFNYARIGKFFKKDKSKTIVLEYDAEKLNSQYGFTPLEAYMCLVLLRDNPKMTLNEIKLNLS